MNNNQIFKNNIFIAKFMDNWTDNGLEPAYYVYNHKGYQFHELLFHKSWDWLMPIVDKIENIVKHQLYIKRCSLDGVFYKYWFIDEISPVYEDNKLNGYYEAVIKFIKWYNKAYKK